MDVSPEELAAEKANPPVIGFNPCSRGCFARRVHSLPPRRSYEVSILVLVDVSPKVQAMTRQASHTQRCFNPCSRGCFARRPSHPSSRPAGYCFNPCSRGCFARRFHNLHTEKIVSLRFNPCSRGCFARRIYCATQAQDRNVSILVLVDVSPEGPVTDSYTPSPTVSILVLVDVSPEAAAVLGTVSAPLFQSLFSWMFRPKTIFYI